MWTGIIFLTVKDRALLNSKSVTVLFYSFW